MKVNKMRRSEFEIKNKEIIDDILNSSEYATLALSCDNKPYSVPVNFVHDGNVVYFHGAKKGKKKSSYNQTLMPLLVLLCLTL